MEKLIIQKLATIFINQQKILLKLAQKNHIDYSEENILKEISDIVTQKIIDYTPGIIDRTFSNNVPLTVAKQHPESFPKYIHKPIVELANKFYQACMEILMVDHQNKLDKQRQLVKKEIANNLPTTQVEKKIKPQTVITTPGKTNKI